MNVVNNNINFNLIVALFQKQFIISKTFFKIIQLTKILENFLIY
jgi:hypothetical protein